MEPKERLLFLYSLAFLLTSFLVYTPHKPLLLEFNKNIPMPETNVKLNGLSNGIIHFKNNTGYAIQVINFNTKIPDTTVYPSNCFNIEICTNANNSLMGMPSSQKWRPPVGSFNHAVVFACRYISVENKEAGPWKYISHFNNTHTVHIVSVLLDPGSLFSFDKGIYTPGKTQLMENGKSKEGDGWWLAAANWNNRGKEWERNAVMQLANPQGELVFSKECGIRISGNATRGFSQKSFRLAAHGTKKNKKFGYAFFSENSYNNYSSLLIRNSGNDWGRTMFADAYIQSLIPHEMMDRQAHLPTVVYINGIYWGLYDLCEKVDEDHLAIKYNVKKKKITLLEGDQLEYGNIQERREFIDLVKFCQTSDFSNKVNYEHFSSKVDIDNLATYLAIEIYIANTDWPNMNVKLYKLDNSKWKFILRDLDCGYSFSGPKAYEKDMFEHLSTTYGPMKIIFTACMKNAEFRGLLKEKLNLVMKDIFSPETQKQKLNEFVKIYEPEIRRQVARWRKPESFEKWQENVREFYLFGVKRSETLQIQIKKHLCQ